MKFLNQIDGASQVKTDSSNRFVSDTEKTKLAGIATGATKNDTDANLKNRANHTGTQTSSTISDFATTVRGTVLTGISTATNAVILATDTVLSALGKLQKQITDNLGTLTTHTSDKNNPHGVTATQLNLDKVNNTADADKPISTAVQTALNGKSDTTHTHSFLPLSGGTLTGATSIKQNMTNGATAAFTSPHLALVPNNTTDTTGFVGMTFGTSTSANYGFSLGALRSTNGNGSLVIRFHNSSAAGTELFNLSSAGVLSATKVFSGGTEVSVVGHVHSYSSDTHVHGNITNDGKVGTVAGLILKTGTGGAVTALAAGISGEYLSHNGTWATPPDTTYSAGPGLTLTGTVFTPTFGNTAGTITQGNDPRLSNARPANGGNADTVDNKHASDFVANGYLGSNGDFNNVVTSGCYRIDAGWINKPTGASDYGTLIVFRGSSGDTLMQMYHNYSDGRVWTRSASGIEYSPSWKVWREVPVAAYRANWNGLTNDYVVGQLGWKNYGNGHTIFDASQGTTPSGTTCNNSVPQVAWSGTYPTLMGWNGSNTYGVKVNRADYSYSAGNAATVGNKSIWVGAEASRGSDANTIYFCY